MGTRLFSGMHVSLLVNMLGDSDHEGIFIPAKPYLRDSCSLVEAYSKVFYSF